MDRQARLGRLRAAMESNELDAAAMVPGPNLYYLTGAHFHLMERPTVLFVTHDLHEALFLADRVLVIGPRPGRIIGTLPVPLPHPRAAEARYSPEVQALVARLWAMLERERQG